MIEIKGLIKSYPGENEKIHAVNRISLTVEAGKLFRLLGPSGYGYPTGIGHLPPGSRSVDRLP